MKSTFKIQYVVAVAASIAFIARADSKSADTAMQVQPASENHKPLAALVGDFKVLSKINAGPGRLITARGEEHGQWILGGRFVEVQGAATPGEAMKGERLILYGYDPAISKFTMHNLDTGSMAVTSATGNYDVARHTFTFDGDMPNALIGSESTHFRWLLRIEDHGIVSQTILVGTDPKTLAEVVTVTHTPRPNR